MNLALIKTIGCLGIVSLLGACAISHPPVLATRNGGADVTASAQPSIATIATEQGGVSVRRNAIAPPNTGGTMPTFVDFVTYYTTFPNWVYGYTVEWNRGETMPQFEYGKTYVAVAGGGTWQGTSFTLTQVVFAKYDNRTFYTNFDYAMPYAFSSYRAGEGAGGIYIYQSASVIKAVEKHSFVAETYFGRGTNTSVYPMPVCQRTYSPQTGGPYYVYNSVISESDSYLDSLEGILINYFTLNQDAYRNGYGAGYRDGKNVVTDSAYQQGKTDGYTEAMDSIDAGGNAIMNLFGAVIGVPISLLNGLSPFVIWNVPIVSIMVSFLFFAVILYIVRKAIGKE